MPGVCIYRLGSTSRAALPHHRPQPRRPARPGSWAPLTRLTALAPDDSGPQGMCSLRLSQSQPPPTLPSVRPHHHPGISKSSPKGPAYRTSALWPLPRVCSALKYASLSPGQLPQVSQLVRSSVLQAAGTEVGGWEGTEYQGQCKERRPMGSMTEPGSRLA